ncbi:uncharacterized protein LOC127834340 isoform X6 [Dreissena polymorpha]|uniref:uncharacterized protein LOC127834340 isoform X6 n=1 Tax=Dreissena polymorpha TaxID=45954 RepID=UPI002263AD3D|nr:uncharacterized protein LOC127834340 isoform X6 [Dreissena polymorpha]
MDNRHLLPPSDASYQSNMPVGLKPFWHQQKFPTGSGLLKFPTASGIQEFPTRINMQQYPTGRGMQQQQFPTGSGMQQYHIASGMQQFSTEGGMQPLSTAFGMQQVQSGHMDSFPRQKATSDRNLYASYSKSSPATMGGLQLPSSNDIMDDDDMSISSYSDNDESWKPALVVDHNHESWKPAIVVDHNHGKSNISITAQEENNCIANNVVDETVAIKTGHVEPQKDRTSGYSEINEENDGECDPEHVQAQVFLGNLATSTTQGEVRKLLKGYDVHVWIGVSSGKPSDVCAFVKFPSLKEAKRYVQEAEDCMLRGKCLEIRFAAAQDFEDFCVKKAPVDGCHDSESKPWVVTETKNNQSYQESVTSQMVSESEHIRKEQENVTSLNLPESVTSLNVPDSVTSLNMPHSVTSQNVPDSITSLKVPESVISLKAKSTFEAHINKEFPQSPLIGLRYVAEYIKPNGSLYLCTLCKQWFTDSNIANHLVGLFHRMNYFKEMNATTYKELLKVVKELGQDAVETVCARYLSHNVNRQEAMVVVPYNKDVLPRVALLIDLESIKLAGLRELEARKQSLAVKREPDMPLSTVEGSRIEEFYKSNTIKNPLNKHIVGLCYITEILRRKKGEYIYVCGLCHCVVYNDAVIAHLTGYKHRIKYFAVCKPEVYKMINNSKEQGLKKFKSVCQRAAQAIEQEEGLCQVLTITEGQKILLEARYGPMINYKASKCDPDLAPPLTLEDTTEVPDMSLDVSPFPVVEVDKDIFQMKLSKEFLETSGILAAAQKVEFSSQLETVHLYKYLQEHKLMDTPLSGLEHIVEIQEGEGARRHVYFCCMCSQVLGNRDVAKSHVQGLLHMETYCGVNTFQNSSYAMARGSVRKEIIMFQLKKYYEEHGNQGISVVVVKKGSESHLATVTQNSVQSSNKLKKVDVSDDPKVSTSKTEKEVKEGKTSEPAQTVIEPRLFDIIRRNDRHMLKPIVGLIKVIEYMNDVHMEEKPTFECKVCNQRLTVTNVHLHLTSHPHYIKYLMKFHKDLESVIKDQPQRLEQYARWVDASAPRMVTLVRIVGYNNRNEPQYTFPEVVEDKKYFSPWAGMYTLDSIRKGHGNINTQENTKAEILQGVKKAKENSTDKCLLGVIERKETTKAKSAHVEQKENTKTIRLHSIDKDLIKDDASKKDAVQTGSVVAQKDAHNLELEKCLQAKQVSSDIQAKSAKKIVMPEKQGSDSENVKSNIESVGNTVLNPSTGMSKLSFKIRSKSDKEPKAKFNWKEEYELIKQRIEKQSIVKCQRASKFLRVHGSRSTRTPLIGLKEVTEFQRPDITADPWYLCFVCEERLDWHSILQHVTSRSHRLAYMKKNYHYLYELATGSGGDSITEVTDYASLIQTTEDAVRELDVMLEMAIDSEDLKKAMQDAGKDSNKARRSSRIRVRPSRWNCSDEIVQVENHGKSECRNSIEQDLNERLESRNSHERFESHKQNSREKDTGPKSKLFKKSLEKASEHETERSVKRTRSGDQTMPSAKVEMNIEYEERVQTHVNVETFKKQRNSSETFRSGSGRSDVDVWLEDREYNSKNPIRTPQKRPHTLSSGQKENTEIKKIRAEFKNEQISQCVSSAPAANVTLKSLKSDSSGGMKEFNRNLDLQTGVPTGMIVMTGKNQDNWFPIETQNSAPSFDSSHENKVEVESTQPYFGQQSELGFVNPKFQSGEYVFDDIMPRCNTWSGNPISAGSTRMTYNPSQVTAKTANVVSPMNSANSSYDVNQYNLDFNGKANVHSQARKMKKKNALLMPCVKEIPRAKALLVKEETSLNNVLNRMKDNNIDIPIIGVDLLCELSCPDYDLPPIYQCLPCSDRMDDMKPSLYSPNGAFMHLISEDHKITVLTEICNEEFKTLSNIGSSIKYGHCVEKLCREVMAGKYGQGQDGQGKYGQGRDYYKQKTCHNLTLWTTVYNSKMISIALKKKEMDQSSLSDEMPVVVKSCQSPSDFYVVYEKDIEAMRSFYESLQAFYGQKYDTDDHIPAINIIWQLRAQCVVYRSHGNNIFRDIEDHAYHRAVIVEKASVKPDLYRVKLVDLGLEFWHDARDIYPPVACFMLSRQSPFAVHCKLHQLQPIGQSWSDEAVTMVMRPQNIFPGSTLMKLLLIQKSSVEISMAVSPIDLILDVITTGHPGPASRQRHSLSQILLEKGLARVEARYNMEKGLAKVEARVTETSSRTFRSQKDSTTIPSNQPSTGIITGFHGVRNKIDQLTECFPGNICGIQQAEMDMYAEMNQLYGTDDGKLKGKTIGRNRDKGFPTEGSETFKAQQFGKRDHTSYCLGPKTDATRLGPKTHARKGDGAKRRARIKTCVNALDDHGKVRVDDKSKVRVADKCKVRVDDKCKVRVDNKCKVRVDDKCKVRVEDKCKVRVDDKSKVRVDDKCKVRVDDKCIVRVELNEELKSTDTEIELAIGGSDYKEIPVHATKSMVNAEKHEKTSKQPIEVTKVQAKHEQPNRKLVDSKVRRSENLHHEVDNIRSNCMSLEVVINELPDSTASSVFDKLTSTDDDDMVLLSESELEALESEMAANFDSDWD